MQEFTITSSQILGACGFIASLWTVYKIILEIKKPSEDLKKRIDKNDELLDNDNRRLIALEKRLSKNDDGQKITMQMLVALADYDIQDKSSEAKAKLSNAKENLQNYLIDR